MSTDAPTAHDCPGRCGAQIPYHLLACRPCWYRLPAGLREPFSEHRIGTSGHRRAVMAALVWYREHITAGGAR